VVARRTSGVSDGFAALFFFDVGVFSGLVFFFFFPFRDVSFAGDFFGFGCADASAVSFGVAEESDSLIDDFLVFDFGVAPGVSPGFAGGSDSLEGDFFFFGVGESDGDFFFLGGELLGFGAGLGDSSSEFTA